MYHSSANFFHGEAAGHPVEPPLQRGEAPPGRLPGREPGGQAVQHLPEVVQLDGLVEVEERDADAAPGEQLHQTFLLEAPERLADRRAADAELGGEIGLAEAGPGREPGVQDRGPERVGRVVDEAAPRQGGSHRPSRPSRHAVSLRGASS